MTDLAQLYEQAQSVTIRSGYVMTAIRDNKSQMGRAWVSNSRYHIVLAWWANIPAGKWAAELGVTVTWPTGRAPLRVQVRAMDTGWHSGTTYQELIESMDWHVRWSDGEYMRFTGPGAYVTSLRAHVDYWQQIRNNGLVIMAEWGQSAGVTYTLRADRVELRLRRV